MKEGEETGRRLEFLSRKKYNRKMPRSKESKIGFEGPAWKGFWLLYSLSFQGSKNMPSDPKLATKLTLGHAMSELTRS